MKKRILVALLAILGSSVLLTAIPGEDQASWSPYPLETEDNGDSLLGGDPSTWSPYPIEDSNGAGTGTDSSLLELSGQEQDVSDNGDSSLLGGDPSTWSPYPIEDSVSVVVNYEKDADEDGTGMLYVTYSLPEITTSSLVKLDVGESTSFTIPSGSLSDLVVWALGRNDDGGFTEYNYIKKGFTDSDVNSDNEVVLSFSDDFTLQN